MSAYEGSLSNNTDLLIHGKWGEYLATQSDELREDLFRHYQSHAIKISLVLYKRFARFGVSLDDMQQAGYIGLLSAIEKFNPDRGVKFEVYASIRIKGEIYNGLTNYSEWADIYQYRKQLEKERIRSVLVNRKRHSNDDLIDVAMDIVMISILELQEENDIGYALDEDGISLVAIVANALKRLPIEQSQILNMHYFYEATFGEIAKTLGRSKSSIYHSHSMALKALREEMMTMGQQEIYF